jgi:hypothetical protein
MKFILGIITGFFQFIGGYFLIFFGAMLGLSILFETLGLVGPENVNPWWNTPVQFISFVLAASLGVWGIGWIAAKLRKNSFDVRKTWWGTFWGSVIGILIITVIYLVQGAVGFMPVLFALGGALLGYYLSPLVWKRAN